MKQGIEVRCIVFERAWCWRTRAAGSHGSIPPATSLDHQQATFNKLPLERCSPECTGAAAALGCMAASVLFVTGVARHTALLAPCPAPQTNPHLPAHSGEHRSKWFSPWLAFGR